MTGLHDRNSKIKKAVAEEMPDLNAHFEEIGIDPQMFTTEWVLDLFSHIIPLNLYGHFLDNFIGDGSNYKNTSWDFFYQVVLTILKFIKDEIFER